MKEITIDDVKSFLNSMNVKIDIYGMVFNGEEIYIKIGLGLSNRQTVCVSFHKPDFQIQYPFK